MEVLVTPHVDIVKINNLVIKTRGNVFMAVNLTTNNHSVKVLSQCRSRTLTHSYALNYIQKKKELYA